MNIWIKFLFPLHFIMLAFSAYFHSLDAFIAHSSCQLLHSLTSWLRCRLCSNNKSIKIKNKIIIKGGELGSILVPTIWWYMNKYFRYNYIWWPFFRQLVKEKLKSHLLSGHPICKTFAYREKISYQIRRYQVNKKYSLSGECDRECSPAHIWAPPCCLPWNHLRKLQNYPILSAVWESDQVFSQIQTSSPSLKSQTRILRSRQ